VSESGGTLDILDALKETGAISEDDLVSMLAEEFGLEMADLSHFSLKDDVAESISPEIARQYHVVPVEIRNGLLVVAIGDPMDLDTVDTLRYVLHRDIEAVIATP